MAQLTITVPDEQVPRILAAFAERVGKDVGDMVAEDIRLELIDLVRKIVRNYELEEARRAVVVSDVDPS